MLLISDPVGVCIVACLWDTGRGNTGEFGSPSCVELMSGSKGKRTQVLLHPLSKRPWAMISFSSVQLPATLFLPKEVTSTSSPFLRDTVRLTTSPPPPPFSPSAPSHRHSYSSFSSSPSHPVLHHRDRVHSPDPARHADVSWSPSPCPCRPFVPCRHHRGRCRYLKRSCRPRRRIRKRIRRLGAVRGRCSRLDVICQRRVSY